MEYLLKTSTVIAVFYLCYKLFLQRDTFFQSNRWFLLVGLFTAFVLPFVVIPIYIEHTPVLMDTYVFSDATSLNTKPEQSITFIQFLYIIYILGVIFFSIRFLIQLFSLAKMIFLNEREKLGLYTYIKTNSQVSPFSFFNWIVYNPDLFNQNELEQIITHEKVHARQYHSIDILLTQLSCIVLWFNPFVWFYNKDLKQNLEFIADQNAQNKSECKKSYQYTLLKTSMPTHQLALTNNFYNSLIKKRIVMLHKSKSKKINRLKYVLVIPILVIFLMSFNTKKIYVEKEVPVLENLLINNPVIEKALIENENIFEEDKKETSVSKSTATKNTKKTNATKVEPKKTNIKNTKKTKAIGDLEIIIITKNFTEADFEKVVSDFKKKGVTVKFKSIKRNDENEITAIKIDVSSKKSSTNYSVSSDEAIKPIKISFDEDKESISIGSGSSKHIYSANSYYIKSKDGKHKISKSGKGNNVFVFSSEDEDYEIIHEDTINFNKHGKKGKYRSISISKNVETIIDDDEDIEVIVESDYDNEEEEDVIILKNANAKGSYKVKTLGKSSNSKIIISDDNGKEPLYILDGKEIKKENVEDIEPNNIKSITVLKDKSAEKKYGKKGKDGVIEINTKKKN
ncbi:hypothetical protein BFR04_07865 [Gaetbulibacter sp. 4G1]|nr:M56 family metallopeptidase [Gaetbulibacter sp. 4G1]PIA78138.1 hypothetical protein BFR04_07865 [Gaetbulibacter sp. 4G1]